MTSPKTPQGLPALHATSRSWGPEEAMLGALPSLPVIKVCDLHLWSTQRLVPSIESDSARLFVVALGMNGQGFGHGRPMRHADTNLRESGRVPGSSDIEVRLVAWNIMGCRADREHLLRTGTLCWDFVQTSIPIGPLSTAVGEQGNGRLFFDTQREDGSSWGAREYIDPMIIERNVSFSLTLDWEGDYRFNDEVLLRAHIIGKYKKPIEVG